MECASEGHLPCDLCSKPIRPAQPTALREGHLVHLRCLSASTRLKAMDACERATLSLSKADALRRRAAEDGQGPPDGASDGAEIPSTETAAPTPRRIVLVDDDAGVRRAMARLLRSAAFAVTTFASAEEFLERPAGEPPDCLVLDVHMGGMSGIELSERLRQAGLTIPIVFVTGRADAATREALDVTGAVTLLKPVDAAALIEAVSREIRPPGIG
jgi:CheY-like chemotaxis protein